jgi:DNA-binding FrmR family transcriptional regulator
MMVEETISKEVLLNRLERLEGQVRGVEKMIEDGRDCESIVTQLGAVRSAIEGVGALLLRNYMKICFDNKNPNVLILSLWSGLLLSGVGFILGIKLRG